MKKFTKVCRLSALVGAALMMAACSSTGFKADEIPASMSMGAGAELSGAHEVPANPSKATGSSTVWVAANKSVSGRVTIAGMTPTAAHIHEAAADANGPVVVQLTKVSDELFEVPANATLTDAQYASYMAGKLYVNVHSKTYPAGEIRVQLSPK
jgi:hypothetical protein